MKHIAHTCNCVPDYVPNVRQVVNNTEIKSCNFYEHATCVSYVRGYFNIADINCLPACTDSVYKHVRAQVKIQKILEKKLKKN